MLCLGIQKQIHIEVKNTYKFMLAYKVVQLKWAIKALDVDTMSRQDREIKP